MQPSVLAPMQTAANLTNQSVVDSHRDLPHADRCLLVRCGELAVNGKAELLTATATTAVLFKICPTMNAKNGTGVS